MTPFAILIPMLAAIIAVAVDSNHNRAKYYAIAGAAISLLMFPLADKGVETTTWFSIGGVGITLTSSVMPINELLMLLVLGIGLLVLVYSAGFIDLPSEQRRYYAEMLAFESAMLAFAMAGDFVVLFIAWEFLSLTSYLLIGFWYDREKAIAAARKAITIVLIGDIALLAAMVMLQNEFGSLQFGTILAGIGASGLPLAPIALLLVAIFSKSAQFPLEEWLPDAMEGPTPVSAFLHSSTMVKAGVFVTIVLFPLFSAAGVLPFMLAIGAVTTAIGIFGATTETHVKRVLAYSTIEELGIMIVAVAGNALLAAIYFFFAQSFYKALLFFSAGSTMKATGEEDLRKIGGIGQNRLIYITTLFGVLALAGFVPFDGFFANAGVDSAFAANLIAYALMLLVSLTTSFYIFRWLFMQSKKSPSQRTNLDYAAAPRTMTYSTAVLAALVLAASAVFFLAPSLFPGTAGAQLNTNPSDAVAETAVVTVGVGIAYFIYASKRKSRLRKLMPEVVANRVYTATVMNSAYNHIAYFVEALAEGFAYIDFKLNAAFDLFGHAVIGMSHGVRRISSGSINAYVALFALGTLVLVLVVVAV